MNYSKVIELADLEALDKFSRNLAIKINPGTVIGFSGPLGAGKTTLISFLSKALGTTVRVSSPSYVLHHEYQCNDKLTIDHWDLYRLNQLPDELTNSCPINRIWLIEWPERAGNALEWLDIIVFLNFSSDNTNRIARVESKFDLGL
jgi:tRNA threonylcarbamoyladenosine biosynthesis protein TsaE